MQVLQSGNCNLKYLPYIGIYYPNMEKGLIELFTGPKNSWSKGKPMFRDHECAFFMFAQGSEDPVSKRPYGPKFRDLIHEYELGDVWESEPGPNPLHNNKPGIIFVWRLDRKKIKKWWTENVYDKAEVK